MSTHVLLISLKELGKRDKMRGLPSILSLFCNKFSKFNHTRAQMLNSIYHMTIKLLLNRVLLKKMLMFCHIYIKLLWFVNFNVWRYITPRRDVI